MSSSEPPAKIQVLATGVYEHVLEDLAAPFARATGHAVAFVITNAGGVIARLEAAGQAADVVMTSAAGIDSLAAKGHVIGATRVDVGGMRLGVAVQAGAPALDIATPAALRDALRAAPVAYIDPHGGGTSGPFLAKAFGRLGVADQVRAHGVLCATGRDVVQAVASGRAALGLTQAGELIGVPGVAFAGFLPDELQVVTVYAMAVAANTKAHDAAKSFVTFITGPVAAERFRSSGWQVASSSRQAAGS
jgi:molybdate transport system substrate-binding protein